MLKKSLVLSFVMAMMLAFFGTGLSLPALAGVGIAEASDAAHGEEAKAAVSNETAAWVKPLAAAAAISFCAFGTALAQMKIGGAGAGAIAERPETAAMFIVLVAIPETIVILGFVIAAMLIVL